MSDFFSIPYASDPQGKQILYSSQSSLNSPLDPKFSGLKIKSNLSTIFENQPEGYTPYCSSLNEEEEEMFIHKKKGIPSHFTPLSFTSGQGIAIPKARSIPPRTTNSINRLANSLTGKDTFPKFDDSSYSNDSEQIKMSPSSFRNKAGSLIEKKTPRKVSFSFEHSRVLYIPSNNVLKQVEKARSFQSSSFSSPPPLSSLSGSQNSSLPSQPPPPPQQQNSKKSEQFSEEILDPSHALTSIFFCNGNLRSVASDSF
ncbi:hypothetical protein BB560_004189 [Smittium megazygosporum]|uniref:Uncharacterized protein n=1 Tax=Smittium megazygosporum TaxID=133381 RepID=A0A2T9Z9Z2_9FUNG|nr:hypothetical protein BB560_004189 [Smittium megazygosporum]